MSASHSARHRLTGYWFATLVCAIQTGCITLTHHAVPANRLPAHLAAESKACRVPINLALLRQHPPEAHLIGPGDVLGVYVHGVLPPRIEEATPLLTSSIGLLGRDYYPPNGSINTPNVGVPLQVDPHGVLPFPLTEPIRVSGLTLTQAADAVRKACVEKSLIQAGRDRVLVTLIKSRVHRVLVMREDSPSDMPTLLRKDLVPYTKHGSAHIVDLPAFENDVLHALAASGGLPGMDAFNDVWILRAGGPSGDMIDGVRQRVEQGASPEMVVQDLQANCTAIRIPLWVAPNQPLPFRPEDIVLQPGDVVYLEPRDEDFFYTGGLLPGGRIPLPRDQDLDVVEAIAYANGAVGGPSGGGVAVFRSGAGPGNIVPPTRVLILRKLASGEQLPIRVDLTKATRDPKQRILIQPGDVVMLHYKPGELMGNVAMNFFNFNVIYDPKQ